METDSNVPRNRDMGYGLRSGHDVPVQGAGMRAMVVFCIGAQAHALPVGDVHECIPAPALSAFALDLPHLPGWFWLGNARVPVIGLAVLMGVRPPAVLHAADLLYRPLLLCRDVGGRWVALLVDRVMDVMEVRADAIRPAGIDRMAGGCIVGEIDRGGEPPAFVMEMDGVLRQGERLRLAQLMAREEQRAALWTANGARDV